MCESQCAPWAESASTQGFLFTLADCRVMGRIGRAGWLRPAARFTTACDAEVCGAAAWPGSPCGIRFATCGQIRTKCTMDTPCVISHKIASLDNPRSNGCAIKVVFAVLGQMVKRCPCVGKAPCISSISGHETVVESRVMCAIDSICNNLDITL